MSLTAEYVLRSPRLPLCGVAAAVTDRRLQLVGSEQPRDGPAVFFVRITGPSLTEFESALGDSRFVREHCLIDRSGSASVYQVVLSAPRPAAMDELTFGKMRFESVTFLPTGWRVKQQFADRDEFDAFREFCREMDFTMAIRRLYESNSTTTELLGLTEKQREALHAAHEQGYFAVPRQSSMADVAASLDIAPSTLSERLHRAQSHLIEHFVCSDLYNTPNHLVMD